MRWHYLIGPMLVLMTWAVFWQVEHFEFVNIDDTTYVTNPHVRTGLTSENVRWALTTTYFSNWHPLTWLSLMLDVQIYGDDAGGFHLTSLLFHTANVLLLFAALRQMTGSPWKSAFVAALFAIHPLHVESVAWVSSRKDVLSTFFGLFALWAYGRYARRPSGKWYLLALTAFVCSLLSKQMLVTLPCLFLLLDYWPLQRVIGSTSAQTSSGNFGGGRRTTVEHSANEARKYPCPQHLYSRLLLEKVPFFAATAGFCVAVFTAQQQSGAMQTLTEYSLATRCFNAVVVYVMYIFQTLWPRGLMVYYPHPGDAVWQEKIVGVPLVPAAALVLAIVTITAIAQARRRPYLLVGWLWYVGTLVPVIGLVQVGDQRMADRYTYVPLVGLFIAVSWLVPSLTPKGFWRRLVLPGLATPILVALMAMAWVQTGYWTDSITLFQQALSVNDKNYLAHTNLGATFQYRGRLQEAILHYRKAVRITPTSAEGYHTLGRALAEQGSVNEAEQCFQKALSIDPENAKVHNNWGYALTTQDRLAEAIQHFKKAISLDTEFKFAAFAHNNCGIALEKQGRFEEAIHHYQQAISLDPKFEPARENLEAIRRNYRER